MDPCAPAVVYTRRTISPYGPVAVQLQFLESREVLEQKKDTPATMLLQLLELYVLQEQQQLQLATLSDRMQNFEERLRQEQLDKVANSERFSTSVAHLQEEIQNLEYTKNQEMDFLMKGVGRPSLENTTSRNDDVSGCMLQASLCCSENVTAKPQFLSSTPPQQRLPVEKALEKGVNALKFGGLGQALHAVPKAPFDTSRSNTARGKQLLTLLKNF